MNTVNHTPKNHPLNQIPPEAMADSDGKFQAKLDFGLRCNAFAAVLAGIKKDVVASAFGVDRRTISHMVNPYSKHYKRVREEVDKMGPAAFKLKFFDEKTLERIRSAKLPTATPKEERDPNAPNARAKSKAGIQTVKPEQCSYNHRLEIVFRAAVFLDGPVSAAGWWYRDLDGPDAEEWCRGDDASLLTSQACLAYAERNIYDA